MSRTRPQAFVHVVYRTRRIERMLAWYRHEPASPIRGALAAV